MHKVISKCVLNNLNRTINCHKFILTSKRLEHLHLTQFCFRLLSPAYLEGNGKQSKPKQPLFSLMTVLFFVTEVDSKKRTVNQVSL